MTSGGGRCRDGTEAAQQCLEAAATLLPLGIGLHCCNTRHRPKMGSASRGSLQLCASPTLVDGGGGKQEEEEDGEADYLPLDGLPAASRRPVAGALPNWGCGTTVGEKYRALYPSIYQCGPTGGEAIVGSDWFILEIVGCLPSAITHHA